MPPGTYERTEETRKKLSVSLKGKNKGRKKPPRSDEHKRKLSEAAKKRVFSKETREKLSKASLGNKRGLGYKHTEEEKRKIGLRGFHYGMKGKKHTDETKRKISESQKGRKGYWEGKKMSEEHRKKLSISHKGNKCHFWRGGISFLEYGPSWSNDLKESIRKRDRFICRLCGKHQDESYRKLDVHHIDYNKKNLDPKNLISLCKNCHSKTNTDREYWSRYLCAP